MSRTNTKRMKRDDPGYRSFEIDAELQLEPELVPGSWGETELKMAFGRRLSSGTYECTHLKVKIPRDTVTRLLHQIRKLHERERAQIAEDLAALAVKP